MINLFSTRLLFCGVIPFLGVLEANQSDSQKHVPVGNRPMTQAEHVAIQEERSLREEEYKLKFSDEELVKNEINQEEPSEVRAVAGMITDGRTAHGVHQYVYYTTHDGAYHKPISISPVGNTVELEDGSIWNIHSRDSQKTLNWLATDILVVTPNHCWFSIYDFRLVNQNTGASVRANLSLGPIYNGLQTHWIVGIDYNNRVIVLEDGSVWNMSYFDDAVVKKWLMNDIVIIGINDGWFAGNKRNILINVNMLNYAACKCINY